MRLGYGPIFSQTFVLGSERDYFPLTLSLSPMGGEGKKMASL
jgi:hypothetical protein